MQRALAIVLALMPGLAAAHPHIFVEAQVEIVMDEQGSLLGVRLTWQYDDYFSLLLTADLGIDPEGDMILTEVEHAVLQAAVLDWPSDFGGDLHLALGGRALDLGPRAEATASFTDGRVSENHFRPLTTPLPMDAPVTVQVYDPYYYVAYAVVAPITLTGGGACAVTYQAADLNAAYSLVDELLYGRAASDVGPDEQFPEVGHTFADTVTLTCDG